MDQPVLRSPQNFINRELSSLEFNQRVLAQSLDPRVPLLERLRFLCISSSNLDEFFEIRVAGLKQLLELGSAQLGPDAMAIPEQLIAIHQRATRLVQDQYACLNDVLLPALSETRIDLLDEVDWDQPTRQWVEQYFLREVIPVLSPLGLDPARPFPRIQNKSLNFIVRLSGKDAYGRDSDLAIVQAPRSLPRIVPLPDEGNRRRLVALSTLVEAFVAHLFEGVQVLGCYQFRLTRNSDLFVDDEEVDDLRRALEGELAQRRYGAAVRLETSANCPEDMVDFLLHEFALTRHDCYQVPGPVNLNRFSAIYDLAQRTDLKYQTFTPGLPPRLVGATDLFAVIRQRDVLLHHPYRSFGPVMDFLRQAATDPAVLAIKQTLYRTGDHSPIVDALAAAAAADKDVTVIIELRARFDEEANIELATRLQEAGAHVMYGVVGYKTHAKMTLIVRRETDGIRRYCHLGTGNYHPKTARTYTDYGLFTCDEAIGADVHEIFLQLTSLTRTPKLRRLLQAPFNLHETLIAMIEREAANAQAGKKARVVVKVNALVDAQAIEALYRASRAGVRVDLIVRGVCAVRPGVPGVSDNIRVVSVVGRFLEHSRVYWFENDGSPELYLASADWMERNFFRRVETAFPVLQPRHRERIFNDLETYLADNTNSWELQSDGTYARVNVSNTASVDAQSLLLERYAGSPSPPSLSLQT
ncbi:MAG TPA: polyphosphate kinase 1 [Steroidobacteraceae bacterium]|jgi:polyphosphate kinase|nr:polyphosphate kinase 1 [Steroidobacteraceae bacterium]